MAYKKGKIVTVFSTKGGVGKTIFTLNLAAIFHTLKKKVLIVDLDFYSGGVAVSLNVNPNKDIYNFVDDLINDRFSEFNDYVVKYNEYIDVLACPVDPRQATKIESKFVETILVNAANKYDVVLVDTTHILNKNNLIALDKADDILLVLSNDPIDLKNAKSMLAIFKDSEINNYYVVLNQSINTDKDFFSNFDIKNIIKSNIDYTISKHFHISDIDNYVIKGEIPLLNKKIRSKKKDDLDKFTKIANRLLIDKEGANHE